VSRQREKGIEREELLGGKGAITAETVNLRYKKRHP
jgi:hypothetical protein